MTWLMVISSVAWGLMAGLIGTAIVRRYAMRRNVLDVPNARSMHVAPVPRGGGLSIVVAVSGACIALAATGLLDWRPAFALLLGGGAVGVIGWIDDHRPVSARVRLVIQLVAALTAVLLLGGLPELRLGPITWRLGWSGVPLAVLGVVWLTNLYNFMDGVDGLAGGFAVLVGVAGAVLLVVSDAPGLAAVALVLAAAAAGFLYWNWPPARIFMGDVGSGFLGFTFGVLAVASEHRAPGSVVTWSLLLGVFAFDGTVTLVRRVARGHDWASPHRSHAYQRLAQSGWSHRSVTTSLLLLALALSAGAAIAKTCPSMLVPVVVSALIVLSVAYRAIERRHPM